jgi:hypothetical protein
MKLEVEEKNQVSQIDTDKLTDKEAAVFEALNNLFKVCEQFNLTSFVRILVDKKKFVGMNTIVNIEKQKDDDYDFLLNTINDYVEKISNGQVTLMRQK